MENRGKSFQDRIKSAKLRNKAIDDIFEVLGETKKAEKFGDFKKQMLLRLATTLLPRLNEHTGEGGEKLFPPPIYGGKSIQGHNSNP